MPGSIQQAMQTAITHHQAGRWVEASRIYQQVLTEQPRHADALHLLGLLARLSGNTQLAISLLKNAVLLRPDAAQYRSNLGIALMDAGMFQEAIQEFQTETQLSPDRGETFNNLGSALTALERFDEAEAVLHSALKIEPLCSAAWNNLGNLYRVQGRADEAFDAYQRSIAGNAQLGAAFSNLGNALKDRGQLPEAIAALRRAVELDPASPAIHSNLVYASCFDPYHDSKQILDEARSWADRYETPLLAPHLPHDNDSNADRKLRIGYVSGDFRNHVIGRNVLPILQHHDHDLFEVHCFSTLNRHDADTLAFVTAADHWHECARMNDTDLAAKMRAEQIDILVDLTLHISGNRLLTFARKPAPVQVTWAGYPGTTGLRSIGYRITDPYLDPTADTDQFYSERSVRLPNSFWCYRPIDGAPEVNPLPALTNKFVTFGSLNNASKATAPALKLWSQVLHCVPNSRFVMLAWTGTLRTRTTDFFRAEGIDPMRIQFVEPVSPAHHLARYHLIDICLDTLPYTGHSTTMDSLWMGVPVVTLSGETSLARGSVTALSNIGLHELIAMEPAEYVMIASKLARDLHRLAELRASLRTRMQQSPLCDEKQFTNDLEAAYRVIWRGWVLSKKPTQK